MQPWASHLRSLFLKLAALALVYMLCRVLFFGFHHAHFPGLGAAEFLHIFLGGLRFDLSAIILSNSLFILLYLMPFPFRERKWYRWLLRGLFILVNSLAVVANCVDLAYFPFTLKRSTADVFNFFTGEMGNDATRLMPTFLAGYWYVVLIGVLLIWLVCRLYNRTEKGLPLAWSGKEILRQFILLDLVILVSVLLYRGGFQLKPISIPDAAVHAGGKNIPLVVSTPFSILKTLDVNTIEPDIYFTDTAEMEQLYRTAHPGKKGPLKKINVMVITLESFSKEFVGALNGSKETFTPFLDSLIGESYSMSNAYANGKRSIEGIPAIVGGIPTWMGEPYSTSAYGSNDITGIGGYLKKSGYYTAFFHGGTNGTMGFDAFASLAGFDHYFGRTEYNNEKDFDGSWGIWDEEFLQFTASRVAELPQPFCVTLFTLSSHHPYPIPAKHKDRFKDGYLPIAKSISYADYSLKRFFESARRMPWYQNTLFVLVADHTGVSADPFYTNQVGNNAIPLLFFMPGDTLLKGSSPVLSSQIDILPSILDYMDYPHPYFAFGSSVFDSTAHHFALSYYGQYEYMEDRWFLSFNGERTLGLFDYATDSLLTNDLKDKESAVHAGLQKKLKAIIQTYQQCLIHNKMKIAD